MSHQIRATVANRAYRTLCVPPIAFCAALATLAALTPVSATAQSGGAGTGTGAGYVNTQFVEGRAGEESGRLVIQNTSVLPRTVYARFEMPSDPGNRNYGFYRTIPPLSSIAYVLPQGVRVFACDGKYWDSYRPDEAFAVTVATQGTHRFTAKQFKPTALRRADGLSPRG